MKTTVIAENEQKAKEVVKNKITFHKIEKAKSKHSELNEAIDDVFKILEKL